MTPIDWAKRPLQKYADFTGRAPRPEYWWFVLAMFVLLIIVRFVESTLSLDGTIAGTYGPISLLLMLATLAPSLAVAVRRLHDSDRSGWWMLLGVPYMIASILAVRAMGAGDVSGLATGGMVFLIGLACALVLLVFMILPGTKGDNRFGPQLPEGPGAAT